MGFSILALKNLYHKKFSNLSIDLNKIVNKKITEIDLTNNKINEHSELNECNGIIVINKDNNPFELIKDFDVDKYLIKTLTISLYGPPLCNRL